jgi:hypothetical protein
MEVTVYGLARVSSSYDPAGSAAALRAGSADAADGSRWPVAPIELLTITLLHPAGVLSVSGGSCAHCQGGGEQAEAHNP